jgi:hypothetical protein
VRPKEGLYFVRLYGGYALKQSTIIEAEASRVIFEARIRERGKLSINIRKS